MDDGGAITPFHFQLGSSSTYLVVAQDDDADQIRQVRSRLEAYVSRITFGRVGPARFADANTANSPRTWR